MRVSRGVARNVSEYGLDRGRQWGHVCAAPVGTRHIKSKIKMQARMQGLCSNNTRVAYVRVETSTPTKPKGLLSTWGGPMMLWMMLLVSKSK